MLEREIVLDVAGTPAAKGSMKCIGQRGTVKHQLIENNAKAQHLWRDLITSHARHQVAARAEKWQPVGVEATFTMARPASHYDTHHRLTANAPEHPVRRGSNDIDKLTRLVLDALQDSELIVDDAQVVEIVARKTYELLDVDTMLLAKKPPAWVMRNPAPDALAYAGARIRVYPIEW